MFKKLSVLMLCLGMISKDMLGMNLDPSLVDPKDPRNLKAAAEMFAENPLWLHKMCCDGNLAMVQLFIAASVPLEIRSNSGLTPLHVAVREGRKEIVAALIKAGASVKVAENNGVTPLHTAAFKGDKELVIYLVEGGADIDAITHKKDTPLYAACQQGNKEVAAYLINQGASINLAGNNGYTPLSIATEFGHNDLVAYLIENGASATTATIDVGHTPLHRAAEKGNRDAVRLLQPHSLVDARDKEGWSPLHLAACWGHTEIVKLLIDQYTCVDARGSNENTPLNLATQNGHEKIVRSLLNKGACVNTVRKNDSWTPLHIAAYWNQVIIECLLITDSFFTPSYKPELNETLQPQEKFFIETLVDMKNYGALKKNLYKLQPWQARLISDQVSVGHQQEIVKAWLEHNSTESTEHLDMLLSAHCGRHLDNIKRALQHKDNQRHTAQEVAAQRNNQNIVSLLNHVCQAKSFNDLDYDLKRCIIANLKNRLAPVTHE